MKKDLKLFYNIGEVSRMLNVSETLLRFWEKEFPHIRPGKSPGGVRQYRKEDIDAIKLVYHLVKVKGMTLPGARQVLTDSREAETKKLEALERLQAVKEELLAIKRELEGIKLYSNPTK
ncbi:MerR family transcriptional regulator [Bacteroides sp. 519]|uniref:MerR family transcriptional regulator n=1 Tax=Bacteroides sp. 519 TaxID=2302937 RepID=UPI0013D22E69|nr:MerR family transcriptional regulator [Bacteroides sp. 519]NDV57139.1 MerR family transcriptional regulator [Bacteroides sp. 519]